MLHINILGEEVSPWEYHGRSRTTHRPCVSPGPHTTSCAYTNRLLHIVCCSNKVACFIHRHHPRLVWCMKPPRSSRSSLRMLSLRFYQRRSQEPSSVRPQYVEKCWFRKLTKKFTYVNACPTFMSIYICNYQSSNQLEWGKLHILQCVFLCKKAACSSNFTQYSAKAPGMLSLF
jgi:hypothetical protein